MDEAYRKSWHEGTGGLCLALRRFSLTAAWTCFWACLCRRFACQQLPDRFRGASTNLARHIARAEPALFPPQPCQFLLNHGNALHVMAISTCMRHKTFETVDPIFHFSQNSNSANGFGLVEDQTHRKACTEATTALRLYGLRRCGTQWVHMRCPCSSQADRQMHEV